MSKFSTSGAGAAALLVAATLPVAASAQDQTEVVDCNALLEDSEVDLDKALDAGCQLSPEQISRLMDNPVGEMIAIPLQYDRLTVKEPVFGTDQTIETIKIIPTFPVRMGDWNLVNRVVMPFVKLPVDANAFDLASFDPQSLDVQLDGPPNIPDPFAGSTTGMSDIVYVGLLTPKKSNKVGNGKIIWAIGPTVVLPTASKDYLGQGKLQVGPAAALAYLGKEWLFGVFPQHWWSIAGDDSRRSVSKTNIQYFISRKLPNQWAIGASPTISIDWKPEQGSKVNLPIGLGVNKTTFFGRLPVRLGVEADYYVVRSDNGLKPKFGLTFSFTPSVPAAFVR